MDVGLNRSRYINSSHTELSDLKPLPTPKIGATADSIANELFGDVAIVLEFIGCYRGLLMPDKSCPITVGMSHYDL